eukprot:scaffold297374_cov14-Tisochrysis_lutea.AAC.1
MHCNVPSNGLQQTVDMYVFKFAPGLTLTHVLTPYDWGFANNERKPLKPTSAPHYLLTGTGHAQLWGSRA